MAAAVQWTRGADGIIRVAAVRDFGIEPVSQPAKRFFATELDENANLPAVPEELWAANRHNLHTPVANPPMTSDQICAWIATQNGNNNLLYDNLPVMMFRGEDLHLSLHNLPAPVQVQDFILNLASVVFAIARRRNV